MTSIRKLRFLTPSPLSTCVQLSLTSSLSVVTINGCPLTKVKCEDPLELGQHNYLKMQLQVMKVLIND